MFVAIGPNCWGKGDNKEVAMKNCAKAGPGMRTLKKHYLLFSVPEDMRIDDIDGSVHSSSGPITLIEKKGQ